MRAFIDRPSHTAGCEGISAGNSRSASVNQAQVYTGSHHFRYQSSPTLRAARNVPKVGCDRSPPSISTSPGTPLSSCSHDADVSAISSIGSQWSLVDLRKSEALETPNWSVQTRTTMKTRNVFRSFQFLAPPRPSPQPSPDLEDPFDRHSESYLPLESPRNGTDQGHIFNFAIYETASKVITRSSSKLHIRVRSKGGRRDASHTRTTPSTDLGGFPVQDIDVQHDTNLLKGKAAQSIGSPRAVKTLNAPRSQLRPLILPQRVAISEALSKEPRHEPPKSLLLPAELARRESTNVPPQSEMVLYALSRVALGPVSPTSPQSSSDPWSSTSMSCATPQDPPPASAITSHSPPHACNGASNVEATCNSSMDYPNNALESSVDWEADLIAAYAL